MNCAVYTAHINPLTKVVGFLVVVEIDIIIDINIAASLFVKGIRAKPSENLLLCIFL